MGEEVGTADASASTPGHDVFISYSHAADRFVAPRLRRRLRRLDRPFYRRSTLDVYLDQANLAATPELWPSLRAEIERSRFYILLASPSAAASSGVAKELEAWLALERRNRLLIAVTEGAVHWDDVRNDFDWTRTDALPRQLSKVFRAEPRVVNLRDMRGRMLSFRSTRVRHGITELGAPILGKSLPELRGEDAKRRRRVMLGGLAVALVVTLAVVVTWISRERASQSESLDRSRRLAESSRLRRSEHLATALALAVEAATAADTAEARRALFDALSAVPYLTAILAPDVHRVAFDRDGSHVAALADGNRLRVWATESGRLVEAAVLPETGMDRLALGRAGATAIVGTSGGRGEPSSLSWMRRWDAHSPTTLSPLVESDDALFRRVAFDDVHLAGIAVDGGVRVWAVTDGTLRKVIRRPGRKLLDVALAADGSRVVAVGEGGEVIVAPLDDSADDGVTLALGGPPLVRVGFDESGRRIVAATRERIIRLDLEDRLVLHDPDDPDGVESTDGVVNSLAFDARRGEVVSFSQAGALERWDWGTGRRASRRVLIDFDQSGCAAISSRGDRLAVCGSDRTLRLLDLAMPASFGARRLLPAPSGLSVSASEGAKRIAVGGVDGAATVMGEGFDAPRVHRVAEDGAVSLALARDGRTLITLGADLRLKHWRLEDKTASDVITLDKHDTPAGVALASNGRSVAVAYGSRDVEVVDLATGARREDVHIEHATSVTELAFATTADVLATASADGEIKVWELDGSCRSPALVAGQSCGNCTLALSADGRALAIDDPNANEIRVVALEPRSGCPPFAGALQFTMSHHPVAGRTRLAFNHDRSVLAWSDGSDITLFDVRARQPFGENLIDASGVIGDLTFDPSGRWLVTLSGAGVGIRDVDVRRWSERACAVANRNLTCDEWIDLFPGEPYRKTCAALPCPEGLGDGCCRE